MPPNARTFQQQFPLNLLAPVLQDFSPPQGIFDPQDDYIHAYGIYTLAGDCIPLGEVFIKRKKRQDGMLYFQIFKWRTMPGKGHRQETEAEIFCRHDELATPLRWSCQSLTRKADGSFQEESVVQLTADMVRDQLVLRMDENKQEISLKGAVAMNWALFDVVQRLPRETFPPLSFTLIHHFNLLKSGHGLSFHGSALFDLAKSGVKHQQPNSFLRLYSYDQMGEGEAPWVYWVDEQGRLLFVVAGTEAYIFRTQFQQPSTFAKR